MTGGLALLLLAGCASPLCEELTQAYAGVQQKARPCLEPAPLPSLDEARCARQLEASCDAEDQARLEAQVACYQRLGTCAPDQKETFLEDITRCDALAPSNACEAAVFQ